MTIDQYIQNLNTRYKTGISREHSYRGDLQALLEQLTEDVLVTNEPARIECGAKNETFLALNTFLSLQNIKV